MATPIIGFYSDKYETRWGKRMPWYLGGSIIALPSFICLFVYPEVINRADSSTAVQTAWYVAAAGLWGVAWACVQISHMSIVNQLSMSNRMRDKLVNNRCGFTYLGNFLILGSALILFVFVKHDIN